MESDNIQSLWQSQELAMNKKSIDRAYLDDIELKIGNSHKRLLRKLYIEIFVGLFIYIGAGLFLFFSNSEKKEILFSLKIILLTALYAIPSTLLVYQSITKIKNQNYYKPLSEHLNDRIRNLKKTLRAHLFAGLMACLFIIIALLTDSYFLSQPLWLKTCGIFYVVLMAILLSPILNYYYSKEIKLLQQHLDELEKV